MPAMAPANGRPLTETAVSRRSGSASLSIFLANLRLLDLDKVPDWPSITPDAFAGTGAQGQKRRVQCVEWALFKLFAIWDPEEMASVSLKVLRADL